MNEDRPDKRTRFADFSQFRERNSATRDPGRERIQSNDSLFDRHCRITDILIVANHVATIVFVVNITCKVQLLANCTVQGVCTRSAFPVTNGRGTKTEDRYCVFAG